MADREDHLAAGLAELLGELDAGLAGSHDEHPARRQRGLVPVVWSGPGRCVGQVGRDGRESRDVEPARGDDDLAASIGPRFVSSAEAAPIAARQAADVRAQLDRRRDRLRVATDSLHDAGRGA